MAAQLQQASSDDEMQQVSEINVTPFIDVILVLLIIFMIAAPLATVDVAVDLPASTMKRQPRPDKPIFVTMKADRSLAVGETPLLRDRTCQASLDSAHFVGSFQATVCPRRQDDSLWRGHGADERPAQCGLPQDRAGGSGERRRAMSASAPLSRHDRRDLLRWGICFVAILSLHGAVAAALLMKPCRKATRSIPRLAVDVDFTTDAFKDARPATSRRAKSRCRRMWRRHRWRRPNSRPRPRSSR